MGDIVLIFFIQNVFIFTIIFWALTWASEFFYKKRNHKTKRKFYECGFKSISDLNLQININFALLCVFLILYDVEFLFLVPIFFNLYDISFFQFVVLLIFIFLILISLIYDFQMQALNWQY